jgi:hypothetical protein
MNEMSEYRNHIYRDFIIRKIIRKTNILDYPNNYYITNLTDLYFHKDMTFNRYCGYENFHESIKSCEDLINKYYYKEFISEEFIIEEFIKEKDMEIV